MASSDEFPGLLPSSGGAYGGGEEHMPPGKPVTIGVEYIVSDRIFDELPPEEQKLWHSHAYEGRLWGLLASPKDQKFIHREAPLLSTLHHQPRQGQVLNSREPPPPYLSREMTSLR
ncbi:hypothetical protein GIB67_039836 [Kingdonia uniflora]|uniref:Uncharacterized protein n=1 Tax=Kingdonia uniflora TaxID=39325 RepID=A0A7J7P377_9MAGN|nr:hypothetical protein GIB67_039836 [Kingdonia uniflora]